MKSHTTTSRCAITLTKRAKDRMRELELEERSFFLLEKSFRVYIEKYPQEMGSNPSVALLLDNKANVRMAEKCKGQVVVLHCVVKQDGLLVTNVTTRAGHISLQSNWRRPVNLSFDLNKHSSVPIPDDLVKLIDSMPVAQESSSYVKKRIASWEGYLKIEERAADIPDMTSRYSRLIFNGDFTRVTVTGCQLHEKEWKSLKDLSVKLKGIDQDIGKVLKANRSANTVEVELHSYMEDQARRQKFDVHSKEVIFSNFAALSQVKRLRQGFKQLENGLAANPELERLLFENKPPVKPVKRKANLQFHNRLNEFQQEAVIGAVSAEDLYVIQGPPGTGKTTVISEICLQNAKAGLRTLVASQSNLAVDNALGRLLANKDIRILRVGRTESIEEEGKKFIEENVGQYWKDHTLKEVSGQFEGRKQREIDIEAEWMANEQEQEQFQQELIRVETELEKKQKAIELYNEIQETIDNRKKDKNAVDEEQKKAIKQWSDIEQDLHQLNEIIVKDELFLASEPNPTTLQAELDVILQEITGLQESVAFQKLEVELNERKQTLEQASASYEKWAEVVKQGEGIIERITNAKKLDSLKWMILEHNVHRSDRVQQLIEELERIRGEKGQLDKLKFYNDKLNSAIGYVEQLLIKQNLPSEQLQQRDSVPTTSAEIDQFLEQLRRELKGNAKIPLQTLVIYLEGLYGRRKFIWQKAGRFRPHQDYMSIAQDLLQQLKRELLQQLKPAQHENRMITQNWQRTVEEERSKLTILLNKQQQMKESVKIIPNAIEILQKNEAKAAELEKKLVEIGEVKLRLEKSRQRLDEENLKLEDVKQQQGQMEVRLEQLNTLIEEQEKKQDELKEILLREPEREHEDILRKLASISFTRESLKEEKQRLPQLQSIQGKWLALLKEANDHDLNEIRKLYVKHANVIGTTCVASARKDFIENYPVFDVVIIDEVSKATPPELLLPMLKGKKVILVGDHHQLPPLLGNDTLEETLEEMAEESDEFEGKAELKQLLKESLFERLFKNLPKSNKTMLAIQYRMHENIMKTISQFYEQENERLLCGLTDSDRERDHLLESPLIKRNNHLLWLDMPNAPAFFEERMKGGKSLYNPSELQRIGGMLKELDEAVAHAKENGRMNADEKKSIGVISFYGEQVKRIDRMIQQELHLRHLTIRTGTVDRFQGMEMDVILLSMVRNNGHQSESIGFAKDYRRLNVALSRARELLVLIGSTKMFTERTKHQDTRKMYGNVLEAVRNQDGLRTLEEVSLHG